MIRSLSSLSASATLQNIGAGLFSFGLTNAISLVAMPLVVRMLGPAEWSIVAACLTVQTVVAFAEAGLSQLVPREVARAAGDPSRLREIHRRSRKTYLAVGVGLLAALVGGADLLAARWFQAPEDAVPGLAMGLRIAAIQALFQLNNGLNAGVWYGLDMHRKASVRACTFALVRQLAGLAAIAASGGLATAYLAAVAAASIVECVLNRRAVNADVVRACASAGAAPPGASTREPALHGALMLTCTVLVGLAVSQMDRLILSRTASLQDLGTYAVVSAIASGLLGLQQPVVRALSPRLVREVAETGRPLRRTLLQLVSAAAVVGIVPTAIAGVLAAPLLRLFLADEAAVASGVGAMRLLFVGVAVSAPLSCAYALLLARGAYGAMLSANLVGIISMVAVVWTFHDRSDIDMGGWMSVAAGLSRLVASAVLLARGTGGAFRGVGR